MKQIINHIELLDLIAKGNTEDLLHQKDLTYKLNALAAIGLVEISEGIILITAKGMLVQKKRTLMQYESTRIQKDMEEFSNRTLKRNSFYIYMSLLLLCIAGVFISFLLIQKI